MNFSNNFFSSVLSSKFGSMFQGRQALPTNNLSNPFSPNDSVAGNHPQKTVLQYPLDIGGTPNQGHFVLFKIKKQQPGELKKNGQGGVKTSASENAVNGVTGETVSSQGGGGATSSFNLNSNTGRSKMKPPTQNQGEQLTFKRAPTVETNQLIALYMPATVEVQYQSAYEDKEIGVLAKAITAVGDAESGRKVDEAGNQLKGEVIPELTRNAMDGAAGGMKAIEFARSGKVVTSRMELIFSGVSKREFNYSFKFLPKSVEEANMVYEIIQVFKKHMLPRLEGDVGTSRTFVTPDVFEIEYHWIGGKGANAYLNKISTCVLQNLSVKYGGGRFSAHTPTSRGPDNLVGSTPPVESEISLSFKELEIITQNNVGRGF